MKKLKLKVTQSQLDDIQYIQEQLNVRFYGDVDDYQEVQEFIDSYIEEADNMEKTIEYAYLVYSDNYTGNRK
jgi:patatin-like phospholipase/acyl hydrolase